MADLWCEKIFSHFNNITKSLDLQYISKNIVLSHKFHSGMVLYCLQIYEHCDIIISIYKLKGIMFTMFSKKNIIALAMAGLLCFSGMSITAFADTETDAETEIVSDEETADAAEEDAEEETADEEEAEDEEASEQIVSGEYTYRIDKEYGGAVITAYKPKEKNVVLPSKIDGVTVVALADYLFDRQSKIETVTIPASICHMGASVFYGTSIKEFIVEEGHSMYKTVDGVLFSKDGIAIVAYPPKKEDKSYVIPDGTEEIYHGCFASNTYLEDLTLPESMIYIDPWAFANTIIQNINIPDKVTVIGSYAFAYMKRLTSIELPPDLLAVESATFAGSSNLVDVKLNNGLKEIGQGAFAGTGVRKIVIPSSVLEIGYCALGYDADLTKSFSTLVIYGAAGSVAQTYATDSDDEYDYKNNFTFIAKTEAQLKAMLENGTDESADEEQDEKAEEATESNVTVEEEKDSDASFIWKIVIICLGGAVLVGGVAAVFISSKKDKSSKPAKKESAKKEPEKTSDENDEEKE